MVSKEILPLLKYFHPVNDPGIDWDFVDESAIIALDNAREEAGVPFIITSNHRTPNLSMEVGGIHNDAHTEIPCTAFDIRNKRPDGRWHSQNAIKIIPALINAGFNRIGVNNKNMHIHCDMSKLLPQDVFFIE